MRRSLLLSLVSLAFFAPSALGATVSSYELAWTYASTITLNAEPGERNETRVEYANDEVVLTDSAELQATEGFCREVDDHTVACPGKHAPITVVLNTGDEADSVDLRLLPAPAAGAPPIRPMVEAGPGDDAIYGSDLDDVLAGGPDHDSVDGAAGSDTLSEGSGGVESDVLIGGEGVDRVSYEGRDMPVDVNVAADAGQGASGENDRISSIEGAVGGKKDDRLAVGAGGGTLDGGPGADELIGSRAGDRLLTGDGSDIVQGGGGDDTIELTGPPRDHPRIYCGRGDDHVWQVFRYRRTGPLAQLARGCENLEARWFEIQQYDDFVIEGERLGLVGSWISRDVFTLGLGTSTRSGRALEACCLRSVKIFDPSGRPVRRHILGSACATREDRVLVRVNAAGERHVRRRKTSRVLLRVTYAYPQGSPDDGGDKYVSTVGAWIHLPKNAHRRRANGC